MASGRAPEHRLRKLREVADEVAVFGDDELDFRAALRWLRKKWKVKCLLCEGGGEINGGLFRAGLVDEIYQTLCPLVFGGRDAPTMADGRGVEALAQATKLRLKSLKRVGDELFLVYRATKRAWRG
ncbi:MAG: 2,5-diamino-6-(ribosylamino)-4(3H)-pyrimidinone 5-phosphate reductase [Verrucomicrobiota bacterium]